MDAVITVHHFTDSSLLASCNKSDDIKVSNIIGYIRVNQ